MGIFSYCSRFTFWCVYFAGPQNSTTLMSVELPYIMTRSNPLLINFFIMSVLSRGLLRVNEGVDCNWNPQMLGPVHSVHDKQCTIGLISKVYTGKLRPYSREGSPLRRWNRRAKVSGNMKLLLLDQQHTTWHFRVGQFFSDSFWRASTAARTTTVKITRSGTCSASSLFKNRCASWWDSLVWGVIGWTDACAWQTPSSSVWRPV